MRSVSYTKKRHPEMVKVGNSPGDTRTTSPSEALGRLARPRHSDLRLDSEAKGRLQRCHRRADVGRCGSSVAGRRDSGPRMLPVCCHHTTPVARRLSPFYPSGWFESSARLGCFPLRLTRSFSFVRPSTPQRQSNYTFFTDGVSVFDTPQLCESFLALKRSKRSIKRS